MFRSDSQGLELFRTATFRLNLAVVAAVLIGVAGSLTFFYFRYVSSETLYLQKSLTLQANDLGRWSEANIAHALEGVPPARTLADIDCIGLFNENLEYIAGNIPSWPRNLRLADTMQQIDDLHVSGCHYKYMMYVIRLPSQHILIFGASERHLVRVRNSLLHTMIFSLLPLTAFTLCLGVYLSHRALARVGALHDAIERIMAGDLSGRLPSGRGRDDLEKLAGSVNRMLGRIEKLMHEIRNVGNDIAHDLRTPLARLRARLERALDGGLDHRQLREVVSHTMNDLDQCLNMIAALLRIAELEDGRRKAGFATHDLREIVAEMVDVYEPIAESRNLRLVDRSERDTPLRMDGDRDLIIELLANLLDNAIKFTPEGGLVEVAASWDGTHIILRVADTGIGIPEAERTAVLGRFYRADKSRHIPGSGLGLSLVMAILRLHDTTLEITANHEGGVQPGAVFQMSFAPHQDAEDVHFLTEPLPEIL